MPSLIYNVCRRALVILYKWLFDVLLLTTALRSWIDMSAKIGFIGAGRMAEAMIKGLLFQELYTEEEIIACAPSKETRERVASNLGITMYENASEVASRTDVLVLAIKPKLISGLFEDEGLALGSRHLLISIAAGIRISALESYVPDTRIVRVMPNHCCKVMEGASGFSRGNRATDEDMETVYEILSSIGLAIEVAEEDLDAVTGVCGSSPAFMYMFAEAIAKVGAENGLSEDIALEFAAQSMVGAGRMMLETGMSPKELVDSVCSPGGTTIEGVKVLEDRGFDKTVQESIRAVIKKSRSMGSS